MSRLSSSSPTYGPPDHGNNWDSLNDSNESTALIGVDAVPPNPSPSARLGFQSRTNLIIYLSLSTFVLFFSIGQLGIALIATSPLDYLVPPGEGYFFRTKSSHALLYIHICSVLLCVSFMVFQFVPKIRRTKPWVHRVNGRIVLLLFIPGGITGMMLCPPAFGGEVASQSALGVALVATVVSACMGYYSIRTGQVMEHRKWMFRWMAYFTSIITSRIIGLIVAVLVSQNKSYNTVWTCDEVNYTLEHETHRGGRPGSFPECGPDSPPSRQVIIPADITDPPLGMASAFRVTVGAGIWLSFALHVIIVETYLSYSSTKKSSR